MSAPAMLTAWATLTGLPTARCQSLEVDLDEGRAPFAAARFALATSPALTAALSQAAIRAGTVAVDLLVRRQWYTAPTLLEVGQGWGGLTLAQVGTEVGGSTLAALAGAWSTAWDTVDPWRAPDELAAHLTVSARDIASLPGQVVVTAASDELRLRKDRVIGARAAEPASTRLGALCAAVGISTAALNLAGLPVVTVPPLTLPDSATTPAWDLLMTTAAAVERRLWCDLTGTWQLTDPSVAPSGSVHVARVADATDTEDASGVFADVVLFVATATSYTTNQSTGVVTSEKVADIVTYPSPVPAGRHAYLTVTQDYGDIDVAGIPFEWLPTPASLAPRLAKVNSTDRQLTATATADPSVRPGQALTTGAPSLPALAGVVSAVSIRIPEDTMTLTARAITEVP